MSQDLVTIDFRGDKLEAAYIGEDIYVAITPICDAIGIDSQRQRQRIRENEILKGVNVSLPLAGQFSDFLRFDFLSYWLATINTARVPEGEIRDRLILYQLECAKVLHDHFYRKVTTLTVGDSLTLESLDLRVTELESWRSGRQGVKIPLPLSNLTSRLLALDPMQDPLLLRIEEIIPQIVEEYQTPWGYGVVTQRVWGRMLRNCLIEEGTTFSFRRIAAIMRYFKWVNTVGRYKDKSIHRCFVKIS